MEISFAFDVFCVALAGIQFRLRVGREHKGYALAGRQFYINGRCKKMVFVIVEAAGPLFREETVAAPFVCWFECGIGAEKIERGCAVEGGDPNPRANGFHAHPPISGMRAGMKIAVIDESFHRKTERAASADHGVLDVTGVLALAHPDAFFEERIGQREPPQRSCAFQAEAFNVEIAFGIDRATGPAIRCERIIGTIVGGRLVQFCD